MLHFNVPVTTNEGIINLKIALKSGTIGPYRIRSLKTVEESKAVPTTIPSAPTAVTSAAPLSPGERVDTDIPGELKKKNMYAGTVVTHATLTKMNKIVHSSAIMQQWQHDRLPCAEL